LLIMQIEVYRDHRLTAGSNPNRARAFSVVADIKIVKVKDPNHFQDPDEEDNLLKSWSITLPRWSRLFLSAVSQFKRRSSRLTNV